MLLKEAEKILKNNGYCLVESEESDIIQKLQKYDFFDVNEYEWGYKLWSDDLPIRNLVAKFTIKNNSNITYYVEPEYDILDYLAHYYPTMKKFLVFKKDTKISEKMFLEYLDTIEVLVKQNYDEIVDIVREKLRDKHNDYSQNVQSSSLD